MKYLIGIVLIVLTVWMILSVLGWFWRNAIPIGIFCALCWAGWVLLKGRNKTS